MNNTPIDESLGEMMALLHDVASHLKSGTKPDMHMAVTKLNRIVALASTLALTIQTRR
jgi:hypothetical protein